MPELRFVGAEGASLMQGWVPAGVQVFAVVMLGAAVLGHRRQWYGRWLLAAGAVGAVAVLLAYWLLGHLGLASEPAPVELWLWVAVTGVAVTTVGVGWRGSRWSRRNLTVFAASMCLLSTGLAINGWIGYSPTVSAAWAQLTDSPLPGHADLASVRAMARAGVRPSAGALVTVTVGSAASGFPHRDELVYLPPAWFASSPPPALPLVMMIAGEFHTTADWVRIGSATDTLDAFAAAHGGNAPVAVFVDSGGAFTNDTECVDGVRGNAADHLVEDVVPFVSGTFGTSSQPAHRGAVGYSSGGTCALNLAVMHPEVFGAFVDIAGDRGPNVGSKEQTVDRLFGGDATAWAAFDPMTVIARHGPYADLAGVFVAPDGSDADGSVPCVASRSQHVGCDVVTMRGRHDWPFAAAAFRETLPWLASRLGTPGVERGASPPRSADAGVSAGVAPDAPGGSRN